MHACRCLNFRLETFKWKHAMMCSMRIRPIWRLTAKATKDSKMTKFPVRTMLKLTKRKYKFNAT